jgi:hypothetical protein
LKKRKALSGNYKAQNPDKYVGDLNNIHYRSSWERMFCKWCDSNDRVIMWSIEPIAIPYYDIGTRKYRKYYPDFFIKMANGKEYLIEIKPAVECSPPAGKRRTRNFIIAEQTYKTNQSKWKAARIFCDQKGWVFRVMDENALHQLGLKVIRKSIPTLKSSPKKKSNTKKIG